MSKDHWNRSISKGIQITMSMVMLHLRGSPGKCPQPDCAGVGIVSGRGPLQRIWYAIDLEAPVIS